MTEKPGQACPYVACGSSDAFSFNTDGFGKCHSCKRGYPSKDETYDWAKEKYPVKEIKKTVKKEIASVTYEGIRGLDPDVAKLYNIQLQLDAEGEPVQYAFQYPKNVKYLDVVRIDGKKKIWLKSKGIQMNDLFGPNFNAGSSKKIYITEGEFDAASLYQALGKTLPVVSLPSSSLSEDFVKNTFKYLNEFEQIIYAGELDDAGKKSAERLYKAYPSKFYYVPLTKWKDANEFLEKGDVSDLKWAALKPQRYAPDNFFCSEDAFDKILREENPYEYLPTGHSGIDYMTRGLVKAGVTFIKAPPGTGKCLHPDQGVLLASGYSVKAKDIKVGDRLLGDDGSYRKVLSTTQGREMMYKVSPKKGDFWVCNESHILSLVNTDTNEVVDISVKDWLTKSDWFKERHKQYRVGVERFSEAPDIPYDPYVVGVYLGDGHKHRSAISLGPKKTQVMKYCEKVFDTLGLSYSEEFKESYTELTFKRGTSPNYFGRFVKDHLFNEEGLRVIPWAYKVATPRERTSLLEGLLDTDGYYNEESNSFEWTTQSWPLCEDFCFVARSLGLAAYWSPKIVKDKEYYRVSLSGDFSPFQFLRHDTAERRQVKDVLRTGISIEPVGVGDYCGFTIDGNRRFLLDDFTVTHNTELVRYFERAVLEADKKLGLIHMEEMKSTTLRAMATYELGVNVRTKEDAIENGVSEEDVIRAAKEASRGENTIIFEMRSSDEPTEIIEYCRMAAGVYGAEYIFIDHIQRLVYKGGVENATSNLTKIASHLAELSKELNIGIICISHLNEEGHTKYAKSLEEEAIICIKISRDKEAEDDREKNTTHFVVEKNRPFSRLGDAGKVFYDPETTILEEVSFEV